jgi:hypothetical protein
MISTKPILCVVAIAAGVACQTSTSNLPDFLAPGKSRGRELLVAAARKVKTDPLRVTNNAAQFLAMHQSVLVDARVALNLPGEAPASAYRAGNASGTWDLVALRRELASLFFIQAKYAAEQHHVVEAADACIDAIRLGQSVEHGPLIDLMIGSGIELGGIRELEKLIPELRPDDFRRVIPRLTALNQSRIAFSEVRRRELYFGEKNQDHPTQRTDEEMASMFKNAEERYSDTNARLSILAATAAAACFRSERRQQISKLEDLLPGYIEAIPIDPYSDGPLRLTFGESGPVIYSVGRNKRDDLGKGDDISIGHKDGSWQKMLFDLMRPAPK